MRNFLQSIQKIGHYTLIEWKLMFRSKLFWVLPIVIGGFFYVIAAQFNYMNDVGATVAEFLEPYFLPLFIASGLFSIYISRKERADKTDLVSASLPYSSIQLLTARWFAMIVPFTIFALVPAVYYAALTFRLLGPIGYDEVYGLLIFSSFVVPVWFFVTLGFVIGVCVKGRWCYLLGIAIILVLITLLQPALSFILPIHIVELINISQVFFSDMGYFSYIWGFVYDQPFWLHKAAYSLLSILLAMTVIFIHMKRRKEYKGRIALFSASSVFILGLVLSAGFYIEEWNERINSFESVLAFYSRELIQENDPEINYDVIQAFMEGTEPPKDAKPLTPKHKEDLMTGLQYKDLKARSYNIHLKTGEGHRLDVKANIELKNNADTAFGKFPMTLRHVFEIKELRVNGTNAQLRWEPNQDVFWIQPAEELQPNQIIDIEIVYSGKLNEWRNYYAGSKIGERWERVVFVDEGKIHLPGYYGWYPRPGNDRLAEFFQMPTWWIDSPIIEGKEIIETHVTMEPADFEVILEASEELKQIVSSGQTIQHEREDGVQRLRFAAESSPGFTIIGGNVRKVTEQYSGGNVSAIFSGLLPVEEAQEITKQSALIYEEAAPIMQLIGKGKNLPPDMLFMENPFWRYHIDNDYLHEPKYRTFGDRELELMNGAEMMVLYLLKYSLGAEYSSWKEKHYKLQYLLSDVISTYISRKIDPKEGPLFSPKSRSWNGEPDPRYILINQIYEKDPEQFPQFFVAFYDFVSREEAPITDDEITLFLQEMAGER
jgi:hypothetical protein